MKKLILAASLIAMPFMAHAVTIDEMEAFSSMSYSEKDKYIQSMGPDERQEFVDALNRERIKEERRRNGITENDVRPICQTFKSVVVEAAQYRDEGYPLHRVSNNADAQLYSANMDQMIPATRNYVQDMYNNPDNPPTSIGERAFNDCMGQW